MIVNVPTYVIPVWYIDKWIRENSEVGSPLRAFVEQMKHDWDVEQIRIISCEKDIKEC